MSGIRHSKTDFTHWKEFSARVLAGDFQFESGMRSQRIDHHGFIDFLNTHGIAVLLLDSLERQNLKHLLTQDSIEELTRLRRIAAVKEVYKLRHIQQTLSLLNQNRIDCLILKGTALAYSLYEQAYLRPRADCDLLIDVEDKHKADSVLTGSGYQKPLNISGDLISYQTSYVQTYENTAFTYDLHWKVTNSNAYADRFEFNELHANSVALPEIGENALRLSHVDGMLHSVVHYFGHYSNERDRLIWLFDLHILADSFRHSDWQDLLTRSSNKALDPLLQQALNLCRQSFNSKIPEWVTQTLNQSQVTLPKIELARVSGETWSRIEQFKSDWASLNFYQRCLLVKEYLLPPGEFILKQNNSSNKLLLPYFYGKRLITGATKLMRKSNNR